MLAHSPPLPLVVDYADDARGLTVEGGEGLWRALIPGERRDRVRRIRLLVHESFLWKFVAALLEGTFPALESLFVKLRERSHSSSTLTLPDTFRAPRLRHLVLTHVGFSLASPILLVTLHLVTLSLNMVVYYHPNELLDRLALLLRLETLEIASVSPVVSAGWEAALREPSERTHGVVVVVLENLRSFGFEGPSSYLEALLPGMSTPLLGALQAAFVKPMPFSVPCLMSCAVTTTTADDGGAFNNVGGAWFRFHHRGVSASLCPRYGASTSVFSLHTFCRGLDRQLSFASQLFDRSSPLIAAVTDLSLDYSTPHISSSERRPAHDDWDHSDHSADNRRTNWRDLLGSFRSVEILRVNGQLSKDVSRSLMLGSEGESQQPLPMLPRLKELQCNITDSETGDLSAGGNVFAPFVYAREATGRPIRLVYSTVPVVPPASTGMSSLAYPS
jgi:hypothetical protein